MERININLRCHFYFPEREFLVTEIRRFDSQSHFELIDRFLEHSRIYYFSSGSTDQVYLGSADWMTRNMERRIELMFPIQDQALKEKLILEILKTYLKDNTHARTLNKDGTYSLKLPKKGESKIRAQQEFIDLAREDGIKSIPYEKAIHYDLKRRGRRPVATKASQKK